MTARLSDRVAGAIILVLAIWYWRDAGSYAVAFGDPAGPSLFPRIVAVPLGLLSLFLLVKPDADPAWFAWPQAASQAITVVVLFAYPLILEPLGFPLATILATTALSKIMGATWLQAVLCGVFVGFGVFFLFDKGFGLPLPVGPLFG